MKIKDPAGMLPVIEGTAEELVKLATAVTAAVNHREAVVFHGGQARIGVRLVDDSAPVEQCGRLLVGRGGDTWDPVCVLAQGHLGRCRPAAPSAPTDRSTER